MVPQRGRRFFIVCLLLSSFIIGAWQICYLFDILVHKPTMKIRSNCIIDKILFLFWFLSGTILKNHIIIPSSFDSSILFLVILQKGISTQNIFSSNPFFFFLLLYFFNFTFFFTFCFDLIKFIKKISSFIFFVGGIIVIVVYHIVSINIPP